MKKVLIVAYAFPPHQAIGSQRPFGLAKYFPQYGWEPVVLTVDRKGETPDGIKVVKARHRNIFSSIKSMIRHDAARPLESENEPTIGGGSKDQKSESALYRFIKEVVYFPDPQRGWYREAVKSAFEYLDREKVHAIISTSTPETDHLVAKRIKQKYRIPWIADFRDPWSQNTYKNKFPIIKYFEQKLELRTLVDADAIVTVTEPWINLLASLHKGKKIYCVTNGYDNDDFSGRDVKLTDKLTITYTGCLYQGKRDPSLLFQVLNKLIINKIINKELMEVRFFGLREEWLTNLIDKYNLRDVVRIYGFVPREKALTIQRESQLLLLLLWNNKGDESVIPGKIFEYLASKRPIISVGASKGAVTDLLQKTNAGKITDNIYELESIILQYYNEFLQEGEIKCTSNDAILNYNYRYITNKYSKILDDIILKN